MTVRIGRWLELEGKVRCRNRFGEVERAEISGRRGFAFPTFHFVKLGLNGKKSLPDFVLGLLVGNGMRITVEGRSRNWPEQTGFSHSYPLTLGRNGKTVSYGLPVNQKLDPKNDPLALTRNQKIKLRKIWPS